ncbi:MAG: NADH-quinone oxidoreductase subunit N, partial [Pirellulales bacterium]|nr:NADH-quinone oxidoreductase subunit N [Pirellulales bacterium]
MNGVSFQTVLNLLPEMILMGAAVLIYLFGAFATGRRVWSVLATVSLATAAIALWQQPDAATGFSGPLVRDGMTSQFRWLTLVLGFLFLLLTSRRTASELASEFVGSLLLLLSGMMVVVGAGDLLLMFLGLELVSIPTYILLYIGHRKRESQEATVKYFYLSIVSSAILLYGFSFVFGISGSTSLHSIHAALTSMPNSAGLLPLGGLAMVLVFAGLAFKIAAVPFHFYAPDVYQGTTHPNAALLAVAPKIVGVIALTRITLLAMPQLGEYGVRIAMILAVLTMTVGNVLALWQINIRRLLAYSSIAHAGYMLVGLAVAFESASGSPQGLGPVLFYLTVYSLATIGSFACLSAASDGKHPLETTHDAAGLARRHPIVAALFALFFLTLAGIPPAMAGFWGKFSIFYDAIRTAQGTDAQNLFIALAVIGMLNAVIAAAYYLRVVAAMYFRPADSMERADGEPGAFTAAVLACGLVLVIGFAPAVIADPSNDSAIGAAKSHQTAMGTMSGDSPLATWATNGEDASLPAN